MSRTRLKLLRTIRFDASDAAVYDVAAPDGEWAISGAFAFANDDPATLTGKTRQAFANGFLGMTSFGRSTFAVVSEARYEDRDELVDRLARHFVEQYGAPDIDAALPVAEGEVAFAVGLAADQPINTVLTVRRIVGGNGEIKEEFRTIRPPSGEPMHARVWTVENDEM
ncbi:MAG TPA: DUF6505 family protein [Hyphomicrobiaceae bacterium]|nr:DUF6505 family protein [Hyphomicrobiaceae bacterium]